MAEKTFNNGSLLDCTSNLHNAHAAIKAAAFEHGSDEILALQHAAEGLMNSVRTAQKAGTDEYLNDAFVRIGCLADLTNRVNVEVDDQLLHAAAVLLHLANAQLSEERVAMA